MGIHSKVWQFTSQAGWVGTPSTPATVGWKENELFGELTTGAFDRTVFWRWTGTVADLNLPPEARAITAIRGHMYVSQIMLNRGIAGSTSQNLRNGSNGLIANLIPVLRSTVRSNSTERVGDWVPASLQPTDTITLEIPIRLETSSNNPAGNRYVYVGVQSVELELQYDETERYEGGSGTSVNAVSVGSGTKATSGGDGYMVNVVAVGSGFKSSSGGSAVGVEVTPQGQGQIDPTVVSGSSGISVNVTLQGVGGDKAIFSGAIASAEVLSTGEGSKNSYGGSHQTVVVVPVGDGAIDPVYVGGGSGTTVSVYLTPDTEGFKNINATSHQVVSVHATGVHTKTASGSAGTQVEVQPVATGQVDEQEFQGGSGTLTVVEADAAGMKQARSPPGGVDTQVVATGEWFKTASGGSGATTHVLTQDRDLKQMEGHSSTTCDVEVVVYGLKESYEGSGVKVKVKAGEELRYVDRYCVTITMLETDADTKVFEIRPRTSHRERRPKTDYLRC